MKGKNKMGFECEYFYHAKIDGGYNKEEKKSFKKKIGEPFEDVPIEKLAASILAQYARRDIFIVDVEINELAKKKVSFKEAKNGIVLKNKKFLFDGGCENLSSIIVEEINQAPSHVIHPHQSQLSAKVVPNGVQPHEAMNRRPREWVTFAPEPHHMNEIKALRLTADKRYPVFDKKEGTTLGSYKYLIVDDLGRENWLQDVYFVPMVNLYADKELGFSESAKQREGGKLYWGNASQENDMPNIRGK